MCVHACICVHGDSFPKVLGHHFHPVLVNPAFEKTAFKTDLKELFSLNSPAAIQSSETALI